MNNYFVSKFLFIIGNITDCRLLASAYALLSSLFFNHFYKIVSQLHFISVNHRGALYQ